MLVKQVLEIVPGALDSAPEAVEAAVRFMQVEGPHVGSLEIVGLGTEGTKFKEVALLLGPAHLVVDLLCLQEFSDVLLEVQALLLVLRVVDLLVKVLTGSGILIAVPLVRQGAESGRVLEKLDRP